MEQNTEKESIKGILSEYADFGLQEQEEAAWEKSAIDLLTGESFKEPLSCNPLMPETKPL